MASDGTLKFDTSLVTDGFQSGMGKVASIAQQALGVFSGQLMTRAADSLVNLGKTALNSVGALEQNVGGVQTLFGETADAVIAAADRAYQTAGMSANDYMSTVTSFSASLLQSLGGNTEEAAKMADTAIIDMADNANKMGTSMDLIQHAYQGFARQSYVMLDNLKLGYGGSKEEMERLLADAQKLTGVKYDINNLSDVYQAIHVVQEELGITGTTAAEASSTLEGSMASAKAAWDNFMNGSSDADQLADAFSTAADNIVNNLAEIIPRFAETLPALAGSIASQIPELTAAIVPAVLSAGQSLLEQARDAVLDFDFVSAAEQVVQTITSFISGDGLATFLGSLGTVFNGIASGISSMLPLLLPALVQLVGYIVQTIIAHIPDLIDAGSQLINGLAEGLAEVSPVLEPVSALLKLIGDNLGTIVPIVAAATAAFAAYKAVMAIAGIISAASAALNGMTVAQYALNLAMSLNPIGLVAAAVAALVAGIIYLWNTNDGFREALIAAGNAIVGFFTSTIPQAFGAVIQWFAQLPANIGTWLTNTLTSIGQWGVSVATWIATEIPIWIESIGEWFAQLPEKIAYALGYAIGSIIKWGAEVLDYIVTNVPVWIDNIGTFFSNLPETIWTWLVNTVTKVVAWGSNMASSASTAMSNMISTVVNWVRQLPDKVWTWLTDTASKVVSWGADLKSKGAEAAKELFDAIVEGVESLPKKMEEIGSDIVDGIWNGIKAGWTWLTDLVAGLAEDLLQGAKDALGIESPSKEFRDQVGRWILPGVGEGLERSMPETLKDMKAKAGELVSAMRAEMSANAGKLSFGIAHSAGLRTAAAGATIYYDNRMEQSNTYHVPVATPSEVARTQREALRNMVGGVK